MKTVLTLILVLLFAPVALAQDLDAMLDRAAEVERGDAEAWTVARDKLVALGKDALPGLKSAARDESWSEEGWIRALAAEVARLRIEDPSLAAKVEAPRGLKPDFYRLTRDGKPRCNRDLRNLGKQAVPLMIERLRYTLDAYEFSENREPEREAYADGLLSVPGELGDTRARFAMSEVLLDTGLPANWRQSAAVSLGQCGGTSALKSLTSVLDDDMQAIKVREACGWALGRVADVKSAEALKQRLEDEAFTTNERLRKGLITGVGLLGSSWGWRARGAAMEETAEKVREMCARMMIEVLKEFPGDHEIIGRSLNLTAWKDSARWLRDLRDDEGADKGVRDAGGKLIPALETAIRRNE